MRKLGLLALVALMSIPAGSASAKTKVDAFAAKYHLKGTWKGKDADKDGLKNLKEFKLGTDPRKADSDKDGLKDGDEVASANDPLKADTDGDGIKDGAEHAGIVTSFDGETVTIRQFKGAAITATVDDTCGVTADDSSFEGGDDGFVDSEETDWSDEGDDPSADASTDDGESDVDLDDDGADLTCDFEDLEEDVVLTQAQLEVRAGVTYLVGVEVA